MRRESLKCESRESAGGPTKGVTAQEIHAVILREMRQAGVPRHVEQSLVLPTEKVCLTELGAVRDIAEEMYAVMKSKHIANETIAHIRRRTYPVLKVSLSPKIDAEIQVLKTMKGRAPSGVSLRAHVRDACPILVACFTIGRTTAWTLLCDFLVRKGIPQHLIGELHAESCPVQTTNMGGGHVASRRKKKGRNRLKELCTRKEQGTLTDTEKSELDAYRQGFLGT